MKSFLSRGTVFGFLFLLLHIGTFDAHAQWSTQSITLVKGWNAVYVQVSPDLMCQALFTNTPVKTVQQFNPVLSAQYETSPANPLQRAPEWLTWSSSTATSIPPTLFSLRAGQSYLFSNDAPCTLVLTGRVENISRTWRADDWHLTGLDVAPGSGLTFGQYFRTLDRIAKLQRVDSDGVSRDIDAGTTIEPGRAYWIKTRGIPVADGSFSIEGGIWLNAADATATLTLSNHSSSTSNTLTFTLADSLPAPTSAVVRVPLMRWGDTDSAYQAIAVGTPFSVGIAPMSSTKLVFRADAAGLEPGKTYHSLLRVIGGGTAYTLPVTYVHDSYGSNRLAWPYGLWVGKATLSEVSFVGAQDSALAEASKPLDIRLILHHGTNGEIRLLSHVVGVLETNDQGSAYRLYTDEKKLPDLTGREVFRISSLAFGMMPPLNLSGSFLGAQPATGHWTLDANDPLNPYRHVFSQNMKEGFAVTNDVIFSWVDGTNAPLLTGTAWKPNGYCTGTYEQRVSGLRHQEIRTRGLFQLEWISGTGSLE